MTLLDEAITYAAKMHSGVRRKGSDIPYILHPMETAVIVSSMTTDEEVLAAAVLHDVLEDTPATFEELKEKFGERVAGLVAEESENKREDEPAADTWRIRKQETIDHLSSPDCRAEVKMIALGDKLSNIRAMSRDYDRLGEALWERFHQKDRRMHEWYYGSLVKAFIDLRDYPAWQEYARYVSKVFFGVE